MDLPRRHFFLLMGGALLQPAIERIKRDMLVRSARPQDLEMPLSGFSDYITPVVPASRKAGRTGGGRPSRANAASHSPSCEERDRCAARRLAHGQRKACDHSRCGVERRCGPVGQQQRLTRAQWDSEVNKMIGWGARVRDDDRNALLDYVFGNFGPRPRESDRACSPRGRHGFIYVKPRADGC
jgi:hypothetical protein